MKDIITMSELDASILQARIKERRKFLKLSYEELATRVGMAKSTLQRYETGSIRNLPVHRVFALAEALEVSPEYFTDINGDYTTNDFSSEEVYTSEKRIQYLKQINKFEKQAVQSIVPFLISDGYKVNKSPRGSIGNIIASKGAEQWYFNYLDMPIKNNLLDNMEKIESQVLARLARLAIYGNKVSTYSLVLTDRVIAEKLISLFRPIQMVPRISIIVLGDDNFEEIPWNWDKSR